MIVSTHKYYCEKLQVLVSTCEFKQEKVWVSTSPIARGLKVLVISHICILKRAWRSLITYVWHMLVCLTCMGFHMTYESLALVYKHQAEHHCMSFYMLYIYIYIYIYIYWGPEVATLNRFHCTTTTLEFSFLPSDTHTYMYIKTCTKRDKPKRY